MNNKTWLVAAGFFTAFQVVAEPSCNLDLTRKPYYRLELTASATFCKGSGKKKDPSCKVFPKDGAIQLHGLWPNYTKDYPVGECPASECPPNRPTYCEYLSPPGLYDSDGWKNMNGYMAGLEKCLERHEWVKHGVCSPMSAPAYFEWSLAKAKEISAVVAPYVDRDLSRSQFNLLMAYKLPDIDGAVNLVCAGSNLLSLNVLYQWGDTPQAVILNKNGQNSFGKCKKSFRIPSK